MNNPVNIMASIPVVILAGGQGTRLRTVISNKPKILAPIGGVPFLYILLNWLAQEGVKDIVFSLGFGAQQVIDALEKLRGSHQLSIRYSVEPEPLGTLGGLSYTLNQFHLEECMVINGDTFVDVKLSAFIEQQRAINSFSGLVAKFVDDTSRYGRLAFKNETYVASFVEKNSDLQTSGWINAGVYYLSSQAIDLVMKNSFGSIEINFLSKYVDLLTYFKVKQGRFIDIGTPESYGQADSVLKEFIL